MRQRLASNGLTTRECAVNPCCARPPVGIVVVVAVEVAGVRYCGRVVVIVSRIVLVGLPVLSVLSAVSTSRALAHHHTAIVDRIGALATIGIVSCYTSPVDPRTRLICAGHVALLGLVVAR